MKSKENIILILCRFTAAIIMLQTLYFKFTAHPDSVYIFTKLGVEPYGRIGAGVAELIASILLLIPRTSWIGALLAIGIMGGAILSHIFVLGIHIMNDGGKLFSLALITLIASSTIVFILQNKIITTLKLWK